MTDHESPIAARVARGLERNTALDPAAQTLRRWATFVVPRGRVGAELRGRSLGHPLHAVLTDLPIGWWTSAAVLDIVGGPGRRSTARTFVGLGVLSAVPTAAAGLADFTRLSTEGARLATVHAALNSTALGCYAASWALRGTSHRAAALAASFAGAAAVSASAFLGGHIAHHRREPADIGPAEVDPAGPGTDSAAGPGPRDVDPR